MRFPKTAPSYGLCLQFLITCKELEWVYMHNNWVVNLPKTYLEQLKVNNFHQSTTKHSVHPKFG